MNKYKNILIVSVLGIGDFVWATSVFPLIRSYDKNIKITLLTFSTYIPLVDKKLIDKTITVNKKLYVYKNIFLRYLYKIYFIFVNYYNFSKNDAIIFLDSDTFFSKIMKLFKIKTIVGSNLHCFGYNIENIDKKYYNHIVNMPKNMDQLHCMIKYQLIIRNIFPTYNLSKPYLVNNNFIFENIKKKYFQKVKKYKIAFCLKGNVDWRYWPINYFVTLIKYINQVYDITAFVFGNDEKQREKIDSVIKTIGSIDIRNLCNKTSLIEYKEILSHMDLLISVDSSAIHIAATQNIPTIALHGQSLPERTGAVNSKVISMCTYEKCSPCDKQQFLDGKTCLYPKCMYNITPEMVFENVKKILK